jgi:DNA (cytosine-5)-methyltransferase 1
VTAYYNEHDPYCAQWLRNLIAAGLIADGIVDERSIDDVVPNELLGYTQCHFFAGIGVWSYALREAGWPDNRPVWTGSCPCQSFSAAGKGKGFADERHLWPAWHHLISQCQPTIVFGEQVDAAIKHGWLDLVQADLEALGYAFGAAVIPAAGVGAPHRRNRVWFVADADGSGQRARGAGCEAMGHGQAVESDSGIGRLGNAIGTRLEGLIGHVASGDQPGRVNSHKAGSVAETSPVMRPGPTNGYWRNVDWLGCRDGKWRPVEPGTFPLASGATSRVGRLRAYGNAINAEVAKAFIEASMI